MRIQELERSSSERGPIRRRARGGPSAAVAFIVGGMWLVASALPARAGFLNLPPPGPNDASGWYPVVGVTWTEPARSDLRDLYSGGIGLSAALGYGIARGWTAEARGDWFRRSGNPDPGLAESASSQLTMIPATLEGVFHLDTGINSSGRPVRVFLGAGPAMVYSKEELSFRPFDTTTTVSGHRVDFGAGFTAGLEFRQSALDVRTALRLLVTGGHRAVVRPDGRTDDRTTGASATLASFGVEIGLP